MSWHVDPPTWQAYAAGCLDIAAEASVETHVTACPECRVVATTLVPDVDPVWRAVHAEITSPRLPQPLRALTRLGVPDDDMVVLASTRDLFLSWSVAVGAAVICACVTGLFPVRIPGGPDALFLILAPLVPVLAVAATYDATDPFREVIEALPFSKLRLILLRTTVALAAAIPLTLGVALVVPGLGADFATWLLPGLALTVAALVLLTWFTAWIAAIAVTGAWIAVASLAAQAGSIDAIATGAGQLGFAVAAVALSALLVRLATSPLAGGLTR